MLYYLHFVLRAPVTAWLIPFSIASVLFATGVLLFRALLHRGAVSGVVDWTNSRFGDPRADLAWTTVILTRVFRTGWSRPIRHLAAGAFIRGWWRGYVRIAGRPVEMPIFCAWAMHGLLRIQASPDRSPRHRASVVALAKALQKLREKAELPEVTVDELVQEAGTR